jgi:quercetin dioxygenase-like cupin family protein
VQRWHLPTVEASGKRTPRVLFSSGECRAVVIDLEPGDALGEHAVHERAVVQVVSGAVTIACGGRESRCEAGTLASFEPGERHAVRAEQHARVLLLLAPWPGDGHYPAGEQHDPTRTPAYATARPID